MNPFDTAHAMASAMGHEMAPWTVHDGNSGFATCTKCGAMLCVAEGWDIFGSATKTHCHPEAKHKYRTSMKKLELGTVPSIRMYDGANKLMLIGPPDDCKTLSGEDVQRLIEGLRKMGWI